MPAIVEESTLGSNIIDYGTSHGIGAVGLPTSAAGQTAFYIIGVAMIASGVATLVAVGALVSVNFLRKRKELKSGKPRKKKKGGGDQKFVLSLSTGAALLISVGTAMLPRTRTMMILHITAGFICIALTLAHIYTYRKVLKVHTKKFWNYISGKSDTKKSGPKSKAKAKNKGKAKATGNTVVTITGKAAEAK